MNTVLKGNNYENECFILINRLLNNYELGLIPSICKVFQKKGYYSKDRRKNIIFDISIEVWLNGADRYSMLVLIECKDYGSERVPVSDVEEFYTKMQQVSATKGIFISSNLYAKGGYNFARSKGITLIQSSTNLTFNIILHKANRHKLLQQEIEVGKIEAYNYDDSFIRNIINNRWELQIEKNIINSFIFHLNSQNIDRESVIPHLSSLDIEDIVNEILSSYAPLIFQLFRAIDWADFKEYLLKVFNLEIIHTRNIGQDSSGRPILSQCLFALRRIEIDASLINTNRYSFIIAHEIGHFFLHNKLSLSQSAYEGFNDTEFDYTILKYKLKNDRNWIEWQANAFASYLIMPKECLIARLWKIQEKIGLRPGRALFVDQQKCNQDDFHTVTRELAIYFNTSKSSIIYRLESLSLIKFDKRRSVKTIGQLLYDHYPHLFD